MSVSSEGLSPFVPHVGSTWARCFNSGKPLVLRRYNKRTDLVSDPILIGLAGIVRTIYDLIKPLSLLERKTEFKVIYENPSKPYRQAARCCYSERCISGDEAMYVVSSDVIRMRRRVR